MKSTERKARLILNLTDEPHIEKELGNGRTPEISLPQEDAHHIINVLRLKVGSQIEVISSGSQKKYSAIVSKTKGDAAVQLVKRLESRRYSSSVAALLFALCKGDTNEWVIEKGCELAIPQIIIWQAERSVVKLSSAADIEKKLNRWRKTAAAASKQSGNPLASEIVIAQSLSAALAKLHDVPLDMKLCCSLNEEAVDLRSLNAPKSCCIVIGPEGDFTEGELRLLEAEDFKFITLGPYTLRAETAAISAVSAVNALGGFQVINLS